MEKTTLEKLEERVKALVPELMELSFGCRIKHKGKGELIFLSQKYCQKKEHDSEYGCDDVDYCNNLACLDPRENRIIYGNYWTPYKILGHPIILDWLLLAISRDGELDQAFHIQADGAMERNYEDTDGPYWEHGKPLDQQPESVLTFLEQYLLKD